MKPSNGTSYISCLLASQQDLLASNTDLLANNGRGRRRTGSVQIVPERLQADIAPLWGCVRQV